VSSQFEEVMSSSGSSPSVFRGGSRLRHDLDESISSTVTSLRYDDPSDRGTSSRPILHGRVPIHDIDVSLGSPSRPSTSTARRRGGSSPVNSTGTTIPPTGVLRSEQAYNRTTTTTSSRRTTPIRRTSDIIEEVKDEGSISSSSSSNGMKASLDAGMARVRRWIRSRPSFSPRTSSSTRSGETWGAHTSPQSPSSPTIRIFLPPGEVDSQESESDDDHHDHVDVEEEDDGDNIFDLPRSDYHRIEYRNPNPRQRTFSEPDGDQIRDLVYRRAMRSRAVRRRNLIQSVSQSTTTYSSQPTTTQQQRLPHTVSGGSRGRGTGIELGSLISSSQNNNNTTSGRDVLLHGVVSSGQSRSNNNEYTNPNSMDDIEARARETSMEQTADAEEMSLLSSSNPDPMRHARNRWITINRRFQYVITMVALIFSLLLFAILLCWVVLTSSYVISIDKACDVPLKFYYWLVTLQLILDVFRSDIMRFFFRWDANSNHRIPCRVITYNVAYLTYALLVLRMGVRSVAWNDDTTTCPSSAPELFQSAKIFICLSVAAWTTIIFGYLVPFIVVATLLTMNGYTPASDAVRGADGAGPFTFFPSVMGAPSHCIDQLPVILLEDFPAHYPMECCICMENFTGTDIIVETACNHVFHKRCCRDWLRQARTCPICRTDIPTSLGIPETNVDVEARQSGTSSPGFSQGTSSSFVNRNDIHHEVVSLLQILRRYERQQQSVLGE